MTPAAPPNSRCGIDMVEISRMEQLLRNLPPDELAKLFSRQEIEDAGTGAGRVASLAARFAAKEACCKLFPRAISLGAIELADFSVRRDGYGAPQVEASPRAQAVMDRHRIGAIRISLTHTEASASAVAMAEMRQTRVPWYGKLIYNLIPYRREQVLRNFRRVFGETLPEEEIIKLAQAYYGHYILFLVEFFKLPWMSAESKRKFIRIENMEIPMREVRSGRSLILLTGHFGNWEVATIAGITQFPEFKGKFHFVRRPLRPEWFNQFITRRFRRAGFGTLAKRGSLDEVLRLLEHGEGAIVYVFDQHANPKDGVTVNFFGHAAGTFRSPALLAMSTNASVVPSSSWREPDGTHVMRFEDPIPLIESEDTGEAIRRNTQAFNDALERILLRHPEQWIWMHRRWKVAEEREAKAKVAAKPA